MSGKPNQPGSRFALEMGITAPTLVEQVGHLLPAEAQTELEHLERDNAAITRIKLRGLLVDSAADRARDKLTKKVIGLLLKHGAIRERVT